MSYMSILLEVKYLNDVEIKIKKIKIITKVFTIYWDYHRWFYLKFINCIFLKILSIFTKKSIFYNRNLKIHLNVPLSDKYQPYYGLSIDHGFAYPLKNFGSRLLGRLFQSELAVLCYAD